MSNPILIEDETPIGDYEIKAVAPKEEEVEKPGFVDTFKAGIVKDNTIINAFTFIDNNVRTGFELMEDAQSEVEPFNGLEQQYLNISKPEWYGRINATSKTEQEFYRKLAQAQIEEEATEIQHTGSTWGTLAAGAINGITSPLMAMPIAQGIKTATFLPGFAGWMTKGLPQLVGGFAAEEAMLYYTQQTRTEQEVARNIVTAAIMGGVLGGIGVGARTLKFKTYKKLVESVADGKEVKFNVDPTNGEVRGFNLYDDTVVGKPIHTIDLVGESLYGFGKNGELHAATPLIWMAGKAFQNPVLKGLMSKSATMKRYTNDLLEHNFDLKGIVGGNSTNREALQTAIWSRQSANIKFEQQLADSYFEYIGVDPSQGLLKKTIQGAFKDKSELLNFPDFSKEFYIATVKGGESEIGPIAAQSKKFINDHLMPIYEELVDLEKLPANLKPKMAMQHVMRMYDREAIIKSKPEKTKFLINKFSETNEKIIRAESPKRNAEYKKVLLEEELKTVTNKETRKVLKAELEEAKKIFEAESKKLESDIQSGIYGEDMLVGDASKGDLKFRRILDKEELELAAENTIDTILGLNEEQMNASISGMLKSGSGGTNPLAPRTLMIDDVELINNGFLQTDIRKNFQAYNLRMSRLIEMEKYLRENGYKGEGPKLDFITKGIKDDYKRMSAELEGKFTLEKEKAIGSEKAAKVEQKYSKERTKLDKEMRKDVNTASRIYQRVMGETGTSNGAILKAIRSLKQYYVSTDMGALFLLCLQDAVAPAFRQGFLPYFNHGIKPFLVNGAKMSKNNAKFRQQAQDMAIGIETLSAFNFSKYDFGQDMSMPMNWMERISGGAAKAMGVLNGTSVWTDAWQHVAATGSLGRTIRDLQAFKAGKLDDSSLRRLLNLRIDPKSETASMMLEQFAKHGEVINDGYLTNFHLWGSEEGITNAKLIRDAKRLLEGATKKEVGSTIFTGANIASYPIVGEASGWMGSFLMYMGWGFNATANYTIPLFQKFEGKRWGGALMMMAISAVVDPLREIAAGREPELDPEMMFKRALLNSGVMGTFGNSFNLVNSMGNIFPGARLDRFRYTRGMSNFIGERTLQDLASLVGMVANNEYNKKDWKRLVRNVPLMNLIWNRKIVNDYIDSLDLPENRDRAEKLKEWR